MTTITIDLDSITTILTAEEIEEIERLGRDACRRVADAMQRVADAHGIDATIQHERVSGKRRDEDAMTWEHLAITLVDEVVEEMGLVGASGLA
jgi:hypothetical protein